MSFVIVNGELIPEDSLPFSSLGQGFGSGEGLFETIKILDGNILLSDLHFDRLLEGIRFLGYSMPAVFSPSYFTNQILKLCKSNQCISLARVRLSVYPAVNDPKQLHYIIYSWPLASSINELNPEGYKIAIYKDEKKPLDRFYNLKSSAAKIYADAAEFVRSHKLDDCLVLNTEGKIADCSIANVFIIKNNRIITPPLSQGCVDGVMRRYLLVKIREASYEFEETAINEADLQNADEVFLTNAIRGIRWVKQFGESMYSNRFIKEIYDRFVSILFH